MRLLITLTLLILIPLAFSVPATLIAVQDGNIPQVANTVSTLTTTETQQPPSIPNTTTALIEAKESTQPTITNLQYHFNPEYNTLQVSFNVEDNMAPTIYLFVYAITNEGIVGLENGLAVTSPYTFNNQYTFTEDPVAVMVVAVGSGITRLPDLEAFTTLQLLINTNIIPLYFSNPTATPVIPFSPNGLAIEAPPGTNIAYIVAKTPSTTTVIAIKR